MENEENVDIGLDNKEVSGADNMNGFDSPVEAPNVSSSEKYDDFALNNPNNEGIVNSAENPNVENPGNNNLAGSGDIPGITVETNSKKPLIFAAAFFVLILIVAVGFYIFKDMNSGTIEDPDGNVVVNDQDMNLVLSDAVSKMENELQSCDFDGTVKLSFVAREDSLYSEEEGNMKYEFSNSGTVIENAQEDVDLYYNFDLDLSTQNVSSGDFFDFSLGFETMLESNRGDDGNRYYFKLNNLSGNSSSDGSLDEEEELQAFLEIFKGSWFRINDKEIEEMFGDTGFMLYNLQKNKPEESGYTFDYTKYDLFSVDGNNAKIVEVNGVQTYLVKLKANPDELIKLFYDISKEMDKEEDRTLEQFLKDEAEDIKKAKEAIDFFMNEFDIEVYIGKEDGYIHRIVAKGSIDQETIKDFAEIIEEEDNMTTYDDEAMFNIDFEIDYTFSNFNSAYIESIPEEDTKSLRTIMDGFLSNLNLSTPDTDGDGLTDGLEDFYGSDINVVDTDGDGYSDFEEVDNGYDPTVAGSAKLDYDKLFESPSLSPFTTVL